MLTPIRSRCALQGSKAVLIVTSAASRLVCTWVASKAGVIVDSPSAQGAGGGPPSGQGVLLCCAPCSLSISVQLAVAAMVLAASTMRCAKPPAIYLRMLSSMLACAWYVNLLPAGAAGPLHGRAAQARPRHVALPGQPPEQRGAHRCALLVLLGHDGDVPSMQPLSAWPHSFRARRCVLRARRRARRLPGVQRGHAGASVRDLARTLPLVVGVILRNMLAGHVPDWPPCSITPWCPPRSDPACA